MQRRTFIILALCVLLCVIPQGALGQEADPATVPGSDPVEAGALPSAGMPWEFARGEVLVKFRSGIAEGAGLAALSELGLHVIRAVGSQGVQLVSVPVGDELKQVSALAADPRVEFAEVNGYYHILITPNDTYYAQQWALPKINAPAAWDISTGANSVTVAVLDTGVDLNHPDLDGKVVAGYDFHNDDANPSDDNGHGTHVAGIIAAESNNATGVAGVSWRARIMPVKVISSSGSGTWDNLADGIDWATAQGADVINMSLGGEYLSNTVQTAVNAAHTAGVLLVASAGNCGDSNYPYNGCTSPNPTLYPAAMSNVCAVGATTSGDARASWSSYGAFVDIAAPGADIKSTYWNDTYANESGTSMACPYVAGLAALVWGIDPSLTNDEVQGVMQSSAVDLGTPGRDNSFGHGRIDALAALQQAVGMAAFDPATLWLSNLKYWGPQNRYPRLVGDMDGDGMADVVAFNPAEGVYVALSSGSAFAKPAQWSSDFAWQNDAYNHRELGDVNGDGKADVVGFRYGEGVYVGLSNGSSLGAATEWLDGLKTWAPQNRFPRMVGNVNGGNKADVVAINPNTGVYVGLSSGTAFAKVAQWTTELDWLGDDASHRAVGDVNGDGKGDLVGYLSGDGVYVALSAATSFAAATEWLDGALPWGPQGTYPWLLGDLDGDGKQDLIAHATDGDIWVAFSTGSAFTAPIPCNTGLAWLGDDPRNTLQVGDVDGANGVDLVAFRYGYGVYVALSNEMP